MKNGKVFEVKFKHTRYTGEPEFSYWVQRRSPALAIAAAEILYLKQRKASLQSAGAVVVSVEQVGTLDA